MKDPNTQEADIYHNDIAKRERAIEEEVENVLSSPEDIAYLLSWEDKDRLFELSRLFFELVEAKNRSDVQLTIREKALVTAVEKIAIEVAKELVP